MMAIHDKQCKHTSSSSMNAAWRQSRIAAQGRFCLSNNAEPRSPISHSRLHWGSNLPYLYRWHVHYTLIVHTLYICMKQSGACYEQLESCKCLDSTRPFFDAVRLYIKYWRTHPFHVTWWIMATVQWGPSTENPSDECKASADLIHHSSWPVKTMTPESMIVGKKGGTKEEHP